MNLPIASALANYPVDSNSERLLKELSDPQSIWYHVRFAEMLGCDYVFVPVQFARRLHKLNELEQFTRDVYELTGSPLSRIVPLQYGSDSARVLRFIKYQLEWSDGRAVAVTRTALNESAQLNFVTTLFEHSEPLIVVA